MSANAAKTFDFLVFIGRFQPLHKGHHYVISTALEQAERVIILVGSSHQPRSIRNPWTFAEREQHIRAAFDAATQERLLIVPLMDDLYNDQNWVARVQQSVNGIVCRYPPKVGTDDPRIGLIGHSKDHSSYYLALFPQWKALNVPAWGHLSSTPLREQYFLNSLITDDLPNGVQQALAAFQQTAAYEYIVSEWRFIRDYQSGWANAPYPPIFVTVDAVVIQAGHILLVERKARPGKGQFALPGGFLNAEEKIRDAVLRELREETRLKIPTPVLVGSISKAQVFDDPHRSSRGRTLTHAYLIELKPDALGLPKVKGSDDAKQAFWLPLAELNPEQMFEDHFHIIKTLVG